MAEDQMRYDLLAQDALRGVVRFALKRVEKTGLPGEHHFYIAFDTNAAGVRISDRLRKQYPQEMTIVLQHQYWGLEVTEERFKVELSFDNIPEKLTVPFESIKGFFDPSVQFGLQFEIGEANENVGPEDASEETELPAQAIGDLTESADGSVPDVEDDGEEPAEKVVSLDSFRKK